MLIKDKYVDEYGIVIGVFNERDFEVILPKLSRYCSVEYAFRLEDSKAETERLKQVCVIFTICGKQESEYYTGVKERETREMLDIPYEYTKNSYRAGRKYDGKNITARFDRFNVTKNPNLYKSDIDSDAWREFMNAVTIDTFQGKKIKLAEKPRDIGGAANLISSGLINGEIEGKHEHCIAAGISEQEVKTINENGDIEIVRKSIPFLSVLNAGKIFEITSAKTKDNVQIEDDGTVVVA